MDNLWMIYGKSMDMVGGFNPSGKYEDFGFVDPPRCVS